MADRSSPQDRIPADPDFDAHLESALNPAQLAAVRAPDGPHLVVAGAGTGKTRTLVHRVAWLVQQGARPESILLLTFTRRAAQEMLRRAAALLDERCRRVAGGTFHAFAVQILRRHADRVGFATRFTILDREDAVDLLALVRAEAGLDRRDRRFAKPQTLHKLFSRQVNTQRPLRDLLQDLYPQFLDDHDAIVDLEGRYRRRKREQNVMDYDDLLVHLRDLLVEHAEARRQVAERFRHVLVDEFQDTNRLQAHLSALLASVHGNLMVVGDDAQSIYGFRGADRRNILDFDKIFPDARRTTLEQNYRSTQPILDLANAVLAQAETKFDKNLFSDHEDGAQPQLVRVADDFAQAEFVARQILEARERGVALSDMAVLARAAWHTNNLELELQQRNLPFRKFGGAKFVEGAHVKDLLALLKLGSNPTDTAAWFRVLQLFEGIGPKTARSILEHVIERGGDPRVLVQPKLTARRYGDDLRRLAELLQNLAGDRPPVDVLEVALAGYTPWMRRIYDDARRRERDFESLIVLAGRAETLDAFLTDLAIDPPEFSRGAAADDPEDEWITLSTVHSAKGLEWHTVFLLHMNAGRFPNANARTLEEMEEERRLLYVATTRARRELFLLKPEELASRGHGIEIGELSPLLADLPDLAARVDERAWTPEASATSHSTSTSDGEDAERLRRIQDYFGS
ncbi:MAG: ATP-dependent helicase [Acidobacteriota bacterium]